MKRLFNKRVRRMGLDDIGSFGAYRKANDIWDDDDWRVVGWTVDDYGRLLGSFGVEASKGELGHAYRRAFIAK